MPVDYAEAYFWIDLAAAGKLDIFKNGDIAKMRDHTGSQLSSAVLLQTQERARKWFDATLPNQTNNQISRRKQETMNRLKRIVTMLILLCITLSCAHGSTPARRSAAQTRT